MSKSELQSRDRAKASSGISDTGLSFRCSVVRDSNGEHSAARCEDAIPISKAISGDRVLLGVADGLGGYAQGFDNQSGGQIASAAAMDAVVDYFTASVPEQDPDAESLTNVIFKRLRHLAETRLAPSRIRGALGRHKLATTLALAVLEDRPSSFKSKVQCYWIGDSRIYFFDAEGLRQLSRDDNLTGDDAFDSLFDPPPMSRFLAASMEREWRINVRELALDCPGVVIACTDGCYSVWRNPWDFEAALQQALEQSESWPEWIEKFQSRLESLLSDDASMAALPINRATFDRFKKLRSEKSGVLSRCSSAESKLDAREIWSSIYKPVYESIPFRAEGRDSCDSKEGFSGKVGSIPVDSDSSRVRPEKCPVSFRSRSRTFTGFHPGRFRFVLAWITGFVCGVPFGEKTMAWLDFFWRWFKSLWQST